MDTISRHATFIQLVRDYFCAGHRASEINRSTAEEWLQQVASAIEQRARDAEHQSRDYACTLLAAIVSEDAAAFLQIGDGAIVISHGEEDGWSWVLRF
jgi:serine/threonine protein phosphatase PrpC